MLFTSSKSISASFTFSKSTTKDVDKDKVPDNSVSILNPSNFKFASLIFSYFSSFNSSNDSKLSTSSSARLRTFVSLIPLLQFEPITLISILSPHF